MRIILFVISTVLAFLSFAQDKAALQQVILQRFATSILHKKLVLKIFLHYLKNWWFSVSNALKQNLYDLTL